MMMDLGVQTQVRVWRDFNAATAVASRRGLEERHGTWDLSVCMNRFISKYM